MQFGYGLLRESLCWVVWASPPWIPSMGPQGQAYTIPMALWAYGLYGIGHAPDEEKPRSFAPYALDMLAAIHIHVDVQLTTYSLPQLLRRSK